jgi:hypothetical protein
VRSDVGRCSAAVGAGRFAGRRAGLLACSAAGLRGAPAQGARPGRPWLAGALAHAAACVRERKARGGQGKERENRGEEGERKERRWLEDWERARRLGTAGAR